VYEERVGGAPFNAERAFDLFIKTYELKYPKVAQCLEKKSGRTSDLL
jgi:hypothetical protein